MSKIYNIYLIPQKAEQGDTWNLFKVTDMFIPLFIVMVSQIYAYVQTLQNAYIKFNFLYNNHTSIKF